MNKLFFNGVELTNETILKTREWFYENKIKCIDDVIQGKIIIYCDKEEYYKLEEKIANNYLIGSNDSNFNFLQRAYYIQTGISIPLLTK